MRLSNKQARRFLLRHHGLFGEHIFNGKEGIMSYIRRVGCIQFDPVDICGRNTDIALNSRVKSYRKEMLSELLYEDRCLVDYFDKNLAIFPVEDLPVFLKETSGGSYAEAYDRRCGDALKRIEPVIRQLINERGHISAGEVETDDTIEWHWGIMTSLPRAALESMYFRGELVIHHKTGTNKSYTFTKNVIPADILSAPLPFRTGEDRLAWHVKRRIGAIGMLWNKASDAWLGLDLKAAERETAFGKLLADGSIFEIAVEGIKHPLYVREEERAVLEEVMAEAATSEPATSEAATSETATSKTATSEAATSETTVPPRIEFIAPLDCMMWDRKLISALFGFDYKWEIYTPKEKRKYCAYALPILLGEEFIGRVEAVRKNKQLIINNVWLENEKPLSGKKKTAFEDCVNRLAELNDCL